MNTEVGGGPGGGDAGELMSLERAIRFLGISRPTIYRMLAQGVLKGLRVGRQWRFRRGDLMSHAMRRPGTLGPQAAGEAADELAFFVSELARVGVEPPDEDVGDVDPASATVIRLCDAMLKLGLKWGASDIHIEPRRSGDSEAVVVRYRVDGVLQPTRRMPGRLLEPVVDRLKLMAGMDLGERHVPQSGRIPVQHEGRRFEMRVTTLPVCGGEAATIRVLFRDASLPDIDHVDLAGDVRRTLDGLLRRPNGVILVSGPTGSGKTTTLYAALQSIAHDGVKVITVEDPVEFLLPYATQVQANPRGGVTTASAIRAMMQHDPDVIAVADVVDAETADLLVQAAMTGHLVLCQLHAQSAAHAIERFTGLCTDAYYASATLLGSLGQRLVRRICDACAASTDPESDAGRAMAHAAERLAEVAGPADGESAAPVWIVGRGCPACRCTGYRRRAAIHALICVDAEVTNAMRRRASADEIEALVAGQAIANMASDGLRKARAGVTTPEEVLRVLGVQP